MNLHQRHVLFAAIGADAPGGLGCQSKQRLDGCIGLRPCLEFQKLTQQRQRDDHRSGFKIDRHAPHRHKRLREHLRRHGRHNAIAECGTGAQADQRPHVRAALHSRHPAALEERQARPNDDRCGECELHPALRRHAQPLQAMPEHGEHEHHNRQRQGPPETTLEISQLGVALLFQAGHFRVQGHAALRAITRVVLAYVRIHRAGVEHVCHVHPPSFRAASA